MKRVTALTSPALAARRYEEARAGVQALIAAGEGGATGLSLFGEAFRNGWGYVFMKRLRDRGLVTALPGAALHGPNSKLLFVAVDALRRAVEDDHVFGALVFPGSSGSVPEFSGTDESDDAVPETAGDPVAALDRMEALRQKYADAEATKAPASIEEEPAAVTDNAAPAEMLDALVKISSAVLENVVYLRRKVDALEIELRNIRKAWE